MAAKSPALTRVVAAVEAEIANNTRETVAVFAADGTHPEGAMTPEQAQKRIQELIHTDLQEGTLAEVEVDDSIHDLTPFLFHDLKPSHAERKKKATSPVGKKKNIAIKEGGGTEQESRRQEIEAKHK